MRREELDKLWQLAGGRCAVCRKKLVRDLSSPNQGHAHPIRLRAAADGLIISAGFFDSYDNRILLCRDDVAAVDELRQRYTTDRLVSLKAAQEDVARLSTDDIGTAITFLAHMAFFAPGGPAYYFLKVANEGSTTVQLDHVWFATNPEVIVDNRQRPLPTRLDPGDLFETWYPVHAVPSDPHILELARVQLGDGSVLKSRENTGVLPAGNPGGGGKPLSSLIRSVAAINHDGARLIDKKYHVFICYAHEDDSVAAPLAQALRDLGLKPWYDRSELRIGDALPMTLATGISLSTFGVVVLSHAFLESRWGKYELTGLLTRSVLEGQIVLPIWHGVTHEEVLTYNPSLAALVARDTAKTSIREIAEEIKFIVVESRRTSA
ncbi:toll/interleukin-1 receptor domain-containing protein [Kibdelosporangium lantanae]|uniref:Toll/interleukin-1 receptor domain-containing protein n=1 Tax=Kibdelosporangium lantanae TaxID=1497396 RepID=A0ABW3M1S2_9PSEU